VRSTLNGGAQQHISTVAVNELRARRGNQRIVGEPRKAGGDCLVVDAIDRLHVIVIRADACTMCRKERGRDSDALVRERWHIALHGRVEVEGAAFNETCHAHGREQLRYASHPELCLRTSREPRLRSA
jgi:hypothetical protein